MSLEIVKNEIKLTEKIITYKEYFIKEEMKKSKIDEEESRNQYNFEFFTKKLNSLKLRKKELDKKLLEEFDIYLKEIIDQLENYENKIKFIINSNKQIFKDDDIYDNYSIRQNKRIEILEEEIKMLQKKGKINENNNKNENDEQTKSKVKDKDNKIEDKVIKINDKVDQNNKIENKNSNIDKKDDLMNRLEQRLKEYDLALKYLIKYQLSENQIEKARNQCLDIKKLIEKKKKGKEIEEYEIPLPPTSELICGINKSTRDEKYKEIINNLISRRDVDIEKRTKFKNSIDKWPESMKKRKHEEISKTLKDLNEKIEKQEKLINSIKELYKNNMAPVPLTIEDSEEVKTEKINEDIEENELLFEISNIEPYLSASFELGFEISEKNVLHFAFESDSSKKYIVSKKVNVGKDLKALLKNGIFLKVTEKYMCCMKKELGEIAFPLDHLGKSADKIIDIMIKPKEGIAKYSMKLHTKMRYPIIEKEFNFETKKVLRISKIYHPFSLTDEVQVEEVRVDKKVIKEIENSEPKNVAIKKVEVDKKNDDNVKKIDVSAFTQKEIENPDSIDFLNSIKVLDQKILECENARAKAEGRCPPEIRTLLLQYKVKRKKIEEMYSDDDYDKNEIVNMLKNRLIRDEALCLYFRNNNMKDKEQIVAKRIPLIQKEINEGEEFLKNAKK